MDYLDLSIDELLLDEDNPRLGSVATQSQALEKIIELNPAHFRNMMLSIKDDGLDPGDSLYVIQADHEDYVVLEGNRRLSALKVLLNPDILEGTGVSDAVKASLVRAAAGFDRAKVEPVRCVLFERREDAHDWIFRRHTGAADGEGRITWGRLEIQRFSGDHSVLDIIDFVGRNADYSAEEWNETRELIESNKSSNLSRLLESSVGQKFLGISVTKQGDEVVPMLSSDPVWVLAVLKRIIEDVRDGVIDSRSLNKSSDIDAYFNGLPDELQPKPVSGNVLQKAFKDINLKPQLEPHQPAKSDVDAKERADKPRDRNTPRVRKTLAAKRHRFKPPLSSKGQRLLIEAARIDANNLTVSSAFVLRAFIELAVEHYMDHHGLPRGEKNTKGDTVILDLSQRTDRVVQHIVAQGKFKSSDFAAFKNNILTKTSPTSIQSLNGFVHNQFSIPTADAIRAGWDSAEPLFMSSFGSE
jgi:hypothetical protein